MTKRQTAPQQSTSKQGGKILPALCNLFGTLLILGVIVLLLPLAIPKLMGYEAYNVVSGSMEPAIPVGSMIIVKPMEGTEIQVSDVIAYHGGENIIVTHRVIENHVVEGEFITKGDANDAEDVTTVPYRNLVGRVIKHYKKVGDIMMHITTTVGKIYLLAVVICGVLFHIIAGRLRI